VLLAFGIRLDRPESVIYCVAAPIIAPMNYSDATVRKLLDAMTLMEERLTATLVGSTPSYLAPTSEAIDKLCPDLDPCCTNQDSIEHHRVEDPSGEEDLQPQAEMVESIELESAPPTLVVYDRYDKPNRNEIIEVLALLEYNEAARITDAIEGPTREVASRTAALEPVDYRRRQVLTMAGEVEQEPRDGVINKVEAEAACEFLGDAIDCSNSEDPSDLAIVLVLADTLIDGNELDHPSKSREEVQLPRAVYFAPDNDRYMVHVGTSSRTGDCLRWMEPLFSNPREKVHDGLVGEIEWSRAVRFLHSSLPSPHQAEVVESSESESLRPPGVVDNHVEPNLYSFIPLIFSTKKAIEEEVPVDMPTKCLMKVLNRRTYSVPNLRRKRCRT
jgi:hypothetical protein